MYPLRFEPIYQYRVWGGRRLAELLSTPLPGNDPIGEAWILSDRDDFSSQVADGPLKGSTLTRLMKDSREELLGPLAANYERFPLLLKFLDAQQVLSVQVHPSDRDRQYLPPGENGKTEAWVILRTGADSRIYAGLRPGTTRENLEKAIGGNDVAARLASFVPKPGDAVLITAGTVHTLQDSVVFEVQQNSDVTFRLYDWDRPDPKTGKPRDLQVDQALACIDWNQVDIGPVTPVVESDAPDLRERILQSDFFTVRRLTSDSPLPVGALNLPRVLICIEGHGEIESAGAQYRLNMGDVVLLPAAVGVCSYRPQAHSCLLEIALPEGAKK